MRKIYLDKETDTLVVIDNDEVGFQTFGFAYRDTEWMHGLDGLPHGELSDFFVTHPKKYFTNKFPNMKLIETQE